MQRCERSPYDLWLAGFGPCQADAAIISGHHAQIAMLAWYHPRLPAKHSATDNTKGTRP